MATAIVNILEFPVDAINTLRNLNAIPLHLISTRVTLTINTNSADSHTVGPSTAFVMLTVHQEDIHAWFGASPATVNDPLLLQGRVTRAQVDRGETLQFFNSTST